MNIEESIDIAVTPDRVMSCYRNVEVWPEWDPDTAESAIDGPFQAGATGRLRPAKGFAVPMRLVSVSKHGFTAEMPAPLCTMRFEHALAPVAGGTRVTHRVSFGGFLAPCFAWLVGRRVRAGLPLTLRNLKQRLEGGVWPGCSGRTT